MSRPQTMELRIMVEDTDYYIFDFNYELFDNDLKQHFEKMFCDYFYFREIGFESPDRFKQRLKVKLNMLYPYYKEYYKTVKQVEVQKFMVTKDLKETFIKEVIAESEVSNTSKQNSTSEIKNDSTSIYSDTPRNKIEDIDKYMTNATKDKANNIGATNGESKDIGNQNNKSLEKTEFTSVGDIGVASSGKLIQGWRNVITNIYQMMFDEMEDLFFDLF